MKLLTCLLVSVAVVVVVVDSQNYTYPVPTPPGGRLAVHGWLILPFSDQIVINPSTDKPGPVRGWFFHHVSEFPASSPHDFHLMVKGSIRSLPTAGSEVATLAFPLPPAIPPYRVEWTFTPPPPFSLNDLLNGALTRLDGVVFNGSFDTSYERIPTNLATLHIEDLPTAIWLNSSSEVPVYQNLQFFSYPFIEPESPYGQNVTASLLNFYFAHELNAPITDYDQIVWMTIDTQQCKCECLDGGDCGCPTTSPNDWYQAINTQSQRWVFPDLPNYPGLKVTKDELTAYAINDKNQQITCNSLIVKEEMHCCVGPYFFDRCDFN
uniref:Uncharacterized protein n=1 Tax=Paramoeba aestuarina TaxID=180227 RepID=A0A7S4NUS1_9EUKA|mmetsp:Transcript_28318/g.43881  ORF Transcript_28318/g.43881 Transcript_28318/m.43881 type:complete len:322 (+) Transcript_28318:139-1104(+)|eukprot:CAMPEP_0201514774 /NCGR_PEP_ID=MMETSP0161_2-20130828/6525_1 /ASSEMBLY_ACC=CAM_ASM_000251 /TAXON_ID=180227 /ORGANISM="Neoparamoeba aestuarina, Strain SoJaBio B1-5/56/2" /LENGTH=321 /DNA_ID=CAMNT_0047911423 /DNA_START=70 /DNA_END=1035 /DNA_ORIENTATION=+